MIQAGDIGGTNTRLAYFSLENDVVSWRLNAKFASKSFDSLDATEARKD